MALIVSLPAYSRKAVVSGATNWKLLNPDSLHFTMRAMTLDIAWAEAADLSQVASPALVLGREAIERNLQQMIQIAGNPERLWPHVKTHKMGWLVQRQIELGITKFKCSTVAEGEMCARAGAKNVLLAMQPVGPNIARLLALRRTFPATKFSTIIDNAETLTALAGAMAKEQGELEVLLDLDVGQHRTGIDPGAENLKAAGLYGLLDSTPGIVAGGLHAYDGHLSQSDPKERAAACAESFASVEALRSFLQGQDWSVPRVIAGGTPTFPYHAAFRDCSPRECSPGTTVLWDASYATRLPDLTFSLAAVLLTRVVSKPGPNRLCLDLGHKAVASEMPHPRVIFPRLPDAQFITHSEEHLVLETAQAGDWPVGSELLGIPWHVCPTVALHAEAVFVEKGRVSGTSPIEARARRISI